MAIFKITNITNKIERRQNGYNSSVEIEYVNSMEKKLVILRSGEVLFMDISTLPISIHKLRAKNLISVIETSKNEMNNGMSVKANLGKPKVSTSEESVVEKVSIKKKNKVE
jgi:hypothetical protein